VTKFTENDLLRLDEQFANDGVPFHARPLRAAMELLGAFSIGPNENPRVSEITRAYARLFPEVRFTWPGMGTGLVASLDRVKKVTIGVVFGTTQIPVYKGLGFSNAEEWTTWCRDDPKILARSAFAFADMYDLVYGIDLKVQRNKYCSTYWGLAAEQLKLVAASLSNYGAINSAVLQPICLCAELALKGTLSHLGYSTDQLRDRKLFGHNLKNLSSAVVREIKHRDDGFLTSALDRFPDYVADRYRETDLTRLEIIDLALATQFVAASAVRRISGEDMAFQIETTGPGPRLIFFS
jgi:hypothetical protein